jgi:RNA polymerase sigma-70 factor (ECF subfamily)
VGVEEFKRLYLPFRQKLYRIAYRLLENSFDAEDIVQDAYAKLWSKRDELPEIEKRESYCCVLVRNLCLDFMRARRERFRFPIEEMGIADDRQFAEQIEMKNELEYIKILLNRLPEQQKNVMKLKLYGEYSNEEIEKITGLSDAHVRVLLSRGRKKIRDLFINEQ